MRVVTVVRDGENDGSASGFGLGLLWSLEVNAPRMRRPSIITSPSAHRSSWPTIAICLVVTAWVGGARIRAAAPDERPSTTGSIEEIQPELFYVPDEGGRLVPVPGFRYRDFVDLFRIKEGLAGGLQPPGAVLENIVVKIDARDVAPRANGHGQVTCPATVEFTVRQIHGGWTPISLESGEMILSAAPRHDGPGRMIVDVEPGRSGYRAWFDATPEAGGDVRHTVVLEGRMPVESTATHEAFAFRVPAAVASQIDVASRRGSPAVAVSPESVEPAVVASPDGGSVVSVRGLAGDVRVRVGDEPVGRGPAALATSESTVRIDGRSAVTETTIRLGNLAAGPRRMTITLPAESALREVKPPATLLARGGTRAAPTADVSLDVAADGTAVVSLVCEQAIDPTGEASFEAVAFGVEGLTAWRQWGRVSLLVDGEWLVTWSDAPQLRRVDPPANVRQPGFVAAFAYDALPASLPLRVRPRRSRVVIEPEYRYDVAGTRVTLDAKFRVAARGAPVGSVVVGIDPAWVVDEIGPPGAVDAAGSTSEDGALVVPFAQPLTGDIVVTVRATLPLEANADRVAWNLPTPRADVVGPAVVAIGARSDIELLPDNESLIGLVRQTAASAAVADADTTALVYRLDAAEGGFAANRRFLPRRIEASIAAQAAVDAAEIAVEQVIRLNVLHVPLESIELAVPTAVVDAGGIIVRQDDAPLDPTEVGSVDEAADEGASEARLRVILQEPLLGEGEITVRFRIPTPTIPPQSTVAIDVPLVQPLEAAIGRETVAISAPDSTVVGVRGDAWRRDVAPAAATTLGWTAMKPQRSVPLTLSTRGVDAARSMVVEAAWLQTRLMGSIREEIRSYVVSSARDAIVMTFPGAARETEANVIHEVRLDGDLVPATMRGGRLVVDLPRTDPVRRWRLDLRSTWRRDAGWSGLAASLGLPGPLALAPPVFEPPVLERRFYWTLHVRPDEHVFGLPAGWTAQQRWQRGTIGWQQHPAATPGQIADWMEAVAIGQDTGVDPVPRGGQLPPLAERSIVFSGVGSPGAAVLWLVPTWCIVLVASGAALGVGLAAIYRPWWRRSGVWVALAASLALAAAMSPDAAPLVAQMAVPGILLAATAGALRLFAERFRDDGPRMTAPSSAASSLTRLNAMPPSLIVTSGIDDISTATQARKA